MDTKNLWSALIKSYSKSEIHCPPDLSVSIDEFYGAMRHLVVKNRIPAEIEMFNVTWDNTEISQKRIIVRYVGEDVKPNENVVQFLIGLDQIGNYTYIEEKVVLEKPVLPKYPIKVDQSPKPEINYFIVVLLLIFYIFPAFIYIDHVNKKKWEYEQNNIEAKQIQAAKEQKDWDNAWESWENNVIHVMYLSSTNDIYGRFIQAISSIVDSTIKEIFEDQKAEIKERIEKAITEEQLHQELEKRKAEFK